MNDQLRYSWSLLQDDIASLAHLVERDELQSGKRFERVVLITRGGLLVGGMLSQWFDKPRVIDTLGIVSYYDVDNAKDITINKLSKSEEYTLLIDDVVDSGATIKLAKECYPNSKVLSLFWKPERSNYKPDFFARETNQWIVFPWEEVNKESI